MDSAETGNVQFTGDKEEYIELVMILADFFVCLKNNAPPPNQNEFQIICNSLGNYLIPVFNVDITPFTNFEELQAGIKPTYSFTRKVIRQLNQLKSDDEFFYLLQTKGITPSYEFIADDMVKWINAENVADKILRYLKA